VIDERIAKLEALLARVLARKREEANGHASHEVNGREAHEADPRDVHLANGRDTHEANGHDTHEANGRDMYDHDARNADDFLASFDTSFAPLAPSASLPSPPPPPSAKVLSSGPSAKLPSPAPFAPLPTPNNAFFPLGPPRTPPPPDRPSATPAKPQAPSSTIAPPDASIDQTLADAAAAPALLRRVPRAEPSSVRAVQPPPGPMEVIELDIDPDPSIAPPMSGGHEEPLESKSRLVSAPPALGRELDDDDLLARPQPSDPTIEVGNVELGQAELASFDDEPAPTSSRRPISMEEKMSELDDAPPLHAAPPESGRLPAANPAIELELDMASTGVHKLQAMLDAERTGELVERTRASERAAVAEFVGAAPTSAAATFGEMLDEALQL
jgi:hypothetical protein